MKRQLIVLALLPLFLLADVAWTQSALESRVWWAWYPLDAIDEDGEVDPLQVVRGQGDFTRLVFPPDVSIRLLTFHAPSNIVTARTLPASPAGAILTNTDFEVGFDDTPDEDEDGLGELTEFMSPDR